ncbi:MAG: putative DNA methylase [Parcubacteria group bacterium GW2011_GWA2_48_9]|nr:MAG: putative DNA methylase [Parcubacteria group bacterium GW2011_GWA2_48_9]
MIKYAFIPGTHPALSLAELRALVDFHPLALSKSFFVVETDKPIEVVKLQDRLGGTIKIVEIRETSRPENIGPIFELNHLLSTYFAQSERKIIFGVSLYGDISRKLFSQMRRLGFETKKNLAESEYPSRFLFDQSGVLSSAAVIKNNILQLGAEIIIIVHDNVCYVGSTVSIQDIDEYSRRDYGRPVRNARSGMLPPKLAQMMINLSGAPLDATLLDPFCGSGTILQEAMRMGYEKLIGADIDGGAVAATIKNLSWFSPKNNVRVIHVSIQKLEKAIEHNAVDVIVTETYLGPPLGRFADPNRLNRIFLELRNLYHESLDTIARILTSRGTAVVAFPLFQMKNVSAALNLDRIISNSPCEVVEIIQQADAQQLSIQNTHGLEYSRPDQRVGRYIVKLRRKS